ncbi:MAG: hypothetical protein GY943_16790 [Chloroflexi bacterium]|nr:hypothetical protein [Chloroflexota bacterium]
MAITQTLSDISADAVHDAQQIALVRLHLFVIGELHKRLGEVTAVAMAALNNRGDAVVTPSLAAQVQRPLLAEWQNFSQWYASFIGTAMRIAASIPFGMWAVYHAAYVLPNLDVEEALLQENTNADVVFDPQLAEIIDAAQQRTHGDNLKLSQRIWQLDAYGRNGIISMINLAAQQKWSAWKLAQSVEQFLGAGQDCPRWTEERLRDLTKQDIAVGDATGLVRGDDCRGQGVSYNALRLARTEIQTIFNMATVHIFKQIPWIEAEKVNLNPQHAQPDECDDVANGGVNGDGVYPVGEIFLPLHPHCMCFRTAELMHPGDFVKKMRSWLNGSTWGAMDQYYNLLNGNLNTDLRDTRIGLQAAYWLWQTSDLAGLFWHIASGG